MGSNPVAVTWKDLKYEAKHYTYNFQKYEAIRSFGDSIYTCKANIVKAEEDQSNMLKHIVEFNDKPRPRSIEGNNKKRDTYQSACALYEGRELTLNGFKSEVFP